MVLSPSPRCLTGTDDPDAVKRLDGPWLKMGLADPVPKKRNGQSTWGLPRHMGGVRVIGPKD